MLFSNRQRVEALELLLELSQQLFRAGEGREGVQVAQDRLSPILTIMAGNSHQPDAGKPRPSCQKDILKRPVLLRIKGFV